jgi:transposase
MQTLHRCRDRLVGERTALINQLRAILLERGITVPQGRRKLEQYLTVMFPSDRKIRLSSRVGRLIEDMRAEWAVLDRQIAAFDNEFAALAKRGNKYLPKLLIHGARSVMPMLAARPTPLGSWLQGLLKRVHKNAAVVALANKLARIVWVMLRRGEEFDTEAAISTTA